MTLDQIKAAVDAGQTVHWSNPGYVVIKDSIGQYLIKSHFGANPVYWGLTHRDGKTVNGKPEEFFIATKQESARRDSEYFPGFAVAMVTPRVNLNGDSGQSLIDYHLDAVKAIAAAKDALRACKPHGRNFQSFDDPYRMLTDADRAWRARYAALEAIEHDLHGVAIQINGQIRRATAR